MRFTIYDHTLIIIMCRRAGKSQLDIWWTAKKNVEMEWGERKRKKSILDLELEIFISKTLILSIFLNFTRVSSPDCFPQHLLTKTNKIQSHFFVQLRIKIKKLFVHFCFHTFLLTYTSARCWRWITYDLLSFWERDLIQILDFGTQFPT